MAAQGPQTGAQARRVREGLGVSQAALAREWGVSPRMVRKIETGGAIPAGYRDAYRELAGGRVVTPARRVTVVRTKGGGTRKVKPPKAGTRTGTTFARGTAKGAPIVARLSVWVPFRDTPYADEYRREVWARIHDAVADAHHRGMPAVVSVHEVGSLGAGGDQAGFELVVTGLPEAARRPRRGLVVLPGDELDEGDVYELVDDAGLSYDD